MRVCVCLRVYVLYVRVYVLYLSQADADVIGTALQCIKFSSFKPSYHGHDEAQIAFHVKPAQDGSSPLPAQLSILRAVRFTDECTARKDISISGFTLSSESMHTLQGLPHWHGCIDLSSCTFEHALPAGLGARLAEHIPLSFRVWVIGRVPREVLQSICDGINHRRHGLGLAPVAVYAATFYFYGFAAGEHVELMGM